MSKGRWFALALLILLLLPGVTTPLYSNALLLWMEPENFIPAESSMLTFEPYQISQGSSSYWLYGQDKHNYYHFTYEAAHPYRYIARDNNCPGFDRNDVRSWCQALQGNTR
ncbi:hypothetical protein [Pseudomonas sp. 2835]|uniref:hypothetical protein n=1 Tax=Pseudomonas sp. 2835 TaxID=3156451 RepID=UPI003D194CD6